MIKSIIFDMGGVVLTGKLEDIIKKVSENLGVDFSAIETPRKRHEKEMLKGEISLKGLVGIVKKESKLGLSLNKF